MKDTRFHDFILEDLLRDVSGVTSRAMFGGWGLYKDRSIFGIVADSVLYLKVSAGDPALAATITTEPFTYEKEGKIYAMSTYRRIPEEWIDRPELLRRFVEGCREIRLSN